MMMLTVNTFIHLSEDVDSDLEETSMRRWESEPAKRRWSGKRNSVDSVGDEQMSTAVGVDTDESESMDMWTCGPTQKLTNLGSRCVDMESMSTADSLRGIQVTTMEMLGTLESLPSLCNDEWELEVRERAYVKNTFINIDDVLEPEFELPQRRACLSEPWPASASVENPAVAEYVATLCSGASKLRETLQVTWANEHAQQECLNKEAAICDTTMSQEWRSNMSVATATEPYDLGYGVDAIDSPPSGSSNSYDIGHGQCQSDIQSAYSSQDVTTLMVCNLPCKLSSEGLTKAVDELGFEGQYDLIYVPKGSNNFMGYGFINFKEPLVAANFGAAIGTYSFPGNSKKQAYCKVADKQGIKANLKKIYRGNNYRKRAQIPLIQ